MAILRAHPEVRKLFGRTPATAALVPLILAVQFGVAYLLKDQPWWLIILAAYTVGAVVNNTAYVIIHEPEKRRVLTGGVGRVPDSVESLKQPPSAIDTAA